jgi:hypothetical protein
MRTTIRKRTSKIIARTGTSTSSLEIAAASKVASKVDIVRGFSSVRFVPKARITRLSKQSYCLSGASISPDASPIAGAFHLSVAHILHQQESGVWLGTGGEQAKV